MVTGFVDFYKSYPTVKQCNRWVWRSMTWLAKGVFYVLWYFKFWLRCQQNLHVDFLHQQYFPYGQFRIPLFVIFASILVLFLSSFSFMDLSSQRKNKWKKIWVFSFSLNDGWVGWVGLEVLRRIQIWERHTRETRDLEKYGFCFNWFWKRVF